MLCFQSVLYCIVLYNDVFTFLYVAVGNKLLLLLLLLCYLICDLTLYFFNIVLHRHDNVVISASEQNFNSGHMALCK